MTRLALVTHESSRDLRRELQDAQADHAAADGRAKIARDIFERAASAEREAADHVARLKGDLEAVRRAATERAAKTISDALRAGSPLPAIWVACRPPIMPPSPLPWLATTRSIPPLQRRRPPFRHRLNFPLTNSGKHLKLSRMTSLPIWDSGRRRSPAPAAALIFRASSANTRAASNAAALTTR